MVNWERLAKGLAQAAVDTVVQNAQQEFNRAKITAELRLEESLRPPARPSDPKENREARIRDYPGDYQGIPNMVYHLTTGKDRAHVGTIVSAFVPRDLIPGFRRSSVLIIGDNHGWQLGVQARREGALFADLRQSHGVWVSLPPDESGTVWELRIDRIHHLHYADITPDYRELSEEAFNLAAEHIRRYRS